MLPPGGPRRGWRRLDAGAPATGALGPVPDRRQPVAAKRLVALAQPERTDTDTVAHDVSVGEPRPYRNESRRLAAARTGNLAKGQARTRRVAALWKAEQKYGSR